MIAWRNFGWHLLAVGVFSALCEAQTTPLESEAIPTFGTTVVRPFGLRGDIYLLRKGTHRLPNFLKLEPIGSIYTSELNVQPRNVFSIGFPGVADRYEWFAIDYTGRFWIDKPGKYAFDLISDDGSKLYIDNHLRIDNDGLHSTYSKTTVVNLGGGIHTIRVSYFQGPCMNKSQPCVALQLGVKPPGADWRTFSTDEFMPPPNPQDWKFGDPSQISTPTDPNNGRTRLRDALKTASNATTVRIENGAGRIVITAVMGAAEVQWRASSSDREVRTADVQFSDTGKEILIRCLPADGARIDLSIEVPHSTELVANSASGSISLNGLIRSATLFLKSGDLAITTPWKFTRIWAISKEAPRATITQALSDIRFHEGRREQFWALADSRPSTRIAIADAFTTGWNSGGEAVYGSLRVVMEAPGRLEFRDMPMPENSWVRIPAEAEELLQSGPRKSQAETATAPEKPLATSDGRVMKGDGRLVSLSVSVFDRTGHPVPGLKPEDFELKEDDVAQPVAFARSEGVPFNLVLLLDLSKSELSARDSMKRATRTFVDFARLEDRVAIHALANSLFQVMAPLTTDRHRLLKAIEEIPEVSGGKTLFDSMVLSAVNESLGHLETRSALVVLSDGMDDQRARPDQGSRVPFERLKSAMEEWHALIYPILLPNESTETQRWGKARLDQLAKASGGRLFEVRSMQDLTQVCSRVAEELRTVYSVGYFPRNQNFDGAWRNLQVRVKRPGVAVRTRPGYLAN